MEPFIHPRKNSARAGFYPYLASFLLSPSFSVTGNEEDYNYVPVDGLQELPAAFEVTPGSNGGNFQRDTPSGERLLLNGYYGTIRKEMQAHVVLDGWEKKYTVVDVEPVAFGTQTVVTLRPVS